MVQLVWNDINIHMKIYAEIPEKIPYKAYAVQNMHRKVLSVFPIVSLPITSKRHTDIKED